MQLNAGVVIKSDGPPKGRRSGYLSTAKRSSATYQPDEGRGH